MWNGEIDVAARRQVANKLRRQYRKAGRADKTLVLDQVVATSGVGLSIVPRMRAGPRLTDPAERADRRGVRARGFSDDVGVLLEHVWALMGMPCGKYLLVICEL